MERGFWSKNSDKLDFLIRWFPHWGGCKVADELGVSRVAVRNKASKLCLHLLAKVERVCYYCKTEFQYARAAGLACRSCFSRRRKKTRLRYLKTAKGKEQQNHLKARYGLSADIYDQLFVSQQEKCAICGTPANQLSKRLCLDHDHSTGRVRGLLCHHCNSGLGFFKDNLTWLHKAVLYLDGSKSHSYITTLSSDSKNPGQVPRPDKLCGVETELQEPEAQEGHGTGQDRQSGPGNEICGEAVLSE